MTLPLESLQDDTPSPLEKQGRGAPGHGPRFGTAAVVGTAVTAVLVAAVTAAILVAFLQIIRLAETAETEVVPLVIQQQEHAVMAANLARGAEIILGVRSRSERAEALAEAEAIAQHFALVADTSSLGNLDAALHAVRRSAYRADVLNALTASLDNQLHRLETLMPQREEIGEDVEAAHYLLDLHLILHGAEAAQTFGAIDAWQTRFQDHLAALATFDGGFVRGRNGKKLEVRDLQLFDVVFDLRSEYLMVQSQAREETITARRLLAGLSDTLSADAAALSSQSATEIVTYGRNGILIIALALGVGLLFLFLATVFMLRHVVAPVLRASAALDAIHQGERFVRLPPAMLYEFDAVSRSTEQLAQALNVLKIKERDALRSQQQLQFIFDVSPVPFLMTEGQTSEIISANKAACALFQMEEDSFIGRLGKDFWGNPSQWDELTAFLNTEEGLDSLEVRLLSGLGREFWALASMRRVELDRGPVLLVGLSEITERKAYEARLHSLVAELETSNRELEQFAYVASHDLQEPLRLIISYLQLLEKRYATELPEDAREFLSWAVDGSRRMQRLIIDLLEYSRVGHQAEPPKPVDMAKVTDYVRDLLSETLGETQGQILVKESLPVVRGSEASLTRLMQNLLTNALKYRAPDRPPHIEVRVKEGHSPSGGKQWDFTIADNGIGIAPEHMERVFQLFQRLHGGETYTGTGLGLAICRKIVEQHGGRIWLDSTGGIGPNGEGCAFCFTLPAG